jgi:Biopolymer transport protein ExbD/TolR
MASIEGGDDSGHKKGPGVKKAKKLSTRVDMTPMVDLGFLLITFFIFTATMSTPKGMKILMPKDVNDPKKQNEAKESGALTILLGKPSSDPSKADQVYFYHGQLKVEAGVNNFESTTFKGIRDIIITKKADVISRHKHDFELGEESLCTGLRDKAKENGDPEWENACLSRDLVVIIKPGPDANYKSMVDILDEMTINQVKTYAIVKILDQELELVRITEASTGTK